MTAMRGYDDEPVGLLKIFRDQTDELVAKEALEQSRVRLMDALEEAEAARAEAEAAGKAKDRFFAMLSHELRTPLTPVMLMSDLLASRDDLPPDLQHAVTLIRRNVELEARFVDDLLDVTKIAKGSLKLSLAPLDLHDVIRKGLEVSRPDMESRRQEVLVELGAGEHHLVGDAARLQQVVWNLLKNASKFTPVAGRIELRTSNPDAHHVCIVVSDNGIGIEAAVMPYIFEAFRQANPAIQGQFGGLGLGLAIVQATVRAHGGEVSANSEGTNRGATFAVILPLTPAQR